MGVLIEGFMEQTRTKGQPRAELTLFPNFNVKLLITAISRPFMHLFAQRG